MRITRLGSALSMAVALASCSLIDLRVMEYATYPASRLEVVPVDSPVWVEFSLPPVHREAEPLLAVTGPAGDVAGWKEWSGDKLTFHPYEPLATGALHHLKLQGAFGAESGARYSSDIVIPFYPGTDEAPPLLVSFSPGRGQVVSVNDPLRLTFSRPMDRLSVERGLSISPKPKLDFSWAADDTILTVTPDPAWANLSYHAWQLPLPTLSREGMPLTRAYAAGYLTQEDVKPPLLAYSGPAVEDPQGLWHPLDRHSLTLADATNDHQLYIEFDEPIDFPSLRSSLSLDPDLAGYLVQVTASGYVYVRTKPFIAGSRYELTLAAGIKDTAGNRTPEKVTIAFTPDVAPLTIDRVIVDNADPTPDTTLLPEQLCSRTPIPGFAYAVAASDFSLGVQIAFGSGSPGFPETDQARRRALVESVACRAVFPPDLATPSIGSFNWIDDKTLRLTLSGLAKSTATSPKYYRFSVTGGKAEAADAAGAYLAEESFFYMEAPL